MGDTAVRQAWLDLPPDEAVYNERTKGGPYDFGFALGMSKVIMAHPRIARVWGPLYQEIMFAPGALDRREREMVAAVTAAAQDCHY